MRSFYFKVDFLRALEIRFMHTKEVNECFPFHFGIGFKPDRLSFKFYAKRIRAVLI